MCICVYVSYVCILYVCVYVCICLVCMCLVCVCMCVCVYVCVCDVSMCIYVYLCVCVCIYVYLCASVVKSQRVLAGGVHSPRQCQVRMNIIQLLQQWIHAKLKKRVMSVLHTSFVRDITDFYAS